MPICKGEKSKNMGTFIGNLSSAGANAAIGSVGGVIGQGLSRLFGLSMSPKEAAKMQWEYLQKMMALQNQYNVQAAEKGQQYAKEYWDYTNAENQVEHLKNAGLNIGLMYGQSGAGGMGASGGSRQEGVDQAQGNPVGMALQAQQLEQDRRRSDAETRLIEAQANKAETEANKIAGVDTQEALKRIEEMSANIQTLLQESRYKEALTTLTNSKNETEKALKALTETNEALTRAKISEAFAIATKYSEEAKTAYWNTQNAKIENQYLKETFWDRVNAAYYNNAVAIALAAKYEKDVEVGDAQIQQLAASAEELNAKAEKENWDKETYRKQVEGMIDYWEDKVFNERIGLGLEFGENIVNMLYKLRPKTSKTSTTSTRRGKTVDTESTTTTSW